MAQAWEPVPGQGALRTAVARQGGVAVLRCTALALRDGGSLVYGPRRDLGDAGHRELGALGRPRVLLAPNHFHHLGLGPWTRRYPDCLVAASESAAPRIRRQAGLVPLPSSQIAPALPDGVSLLEPPGLRNGETWLRVEGEGGVAWIVGDAFFHLERRPPGPVGWFLACTQGCPGLRIGQSFRWAGLRDAQAYGAWLLGRLAADRPTALVPAHGAVAVGADLPERLEALVRRRLPEAGRALG